MQNDQEYFPVLGPCNLEYKKLDLSIRSELAKTNVHSWHSYLTDLPLIEKSIIYYGGYLEKRFFYTNEKLFGSGKDKREYHLGIDLWVQTETPIHAPLNSIVHSIGNNQNNLDYGHTIILKHPSNTNFNYSLYGHLSSWHLSQLKVNKEIKKGEIFCKVGNQEENGGWPPHLHLQVMKHLNGNIGDYPGVSSAAMLEYYKVNCPNPISLIF